MPVHKKNSASPDDIESCPLLFDPFRPSLPWSNLRDTNRPRARCHLVAELLQEVLGVQRDFCSSFWRTLQGTTSFYTRRNCGGDSACIAFLWQGPFHIWEWWTHQTYWFCPGLFANKNSTRIVREHILFAFDLIQSRVWLNEFRMELVPKSITVKLEQNSECIATLSTIKYESGLLYQITED